MKQILSAFAATIKSRKVLLLAFLSVYSIFLPYQVQAVIVRITLKPIQQVISIGLMASGFLLAGTFSYFLYTALCKTISGETQQVIFNLGAFITIIGLSFLYFSIAGMLNILSRPVFQLLSYFFAGLPVQLFDPINILCILGIILCIPLFIITVVAGIFIVYYKLPVIKLLTAFNKASIFLFKNLRISIRILLITLILIILLIVSGLLGVYLISLLSFTSWLQMFYEGFLITCLAGFSTALLIGTIVKLIYPSLNDQGPAMDKSASPIALLFLPILIAVGILLNYQALPDEKSQLAQAVKVEYSLGELYRLKGELDLSGYHYKRGYALCQAVSEYVKLRTTQIDPSYSDEEKNKALQGFDTAYQGIYQINPSIGFYYYLNALRFEKTNQPQEELKSLESAAIYLPQFPNASYRMISLYSQNSTNRDKIKLIYERIIKNRMFHIYRPLDDLNSNELKEFGELVEKSSQNFLNKIPVLAINFYTNKMYDEAMAVLKGLEPQMPDNILVNYLESVTDLEMKQDNKTYTIALDAAERILNKYPDKKWAMEYKANVASKAGNKVIAERMLAELYKNYPDDLDIAEQYAYSLMRKNTGFTFADTDRLAEEILDMILAVANKRWFAIYSKSVLMIKKSDFAGSLAYLSDFSELMKNRNDSIEYYDNLYYLYVLKYKNFITNPEAKKALENIKSRDSMAYNYIYGAYYWSVKDYDNAQVCLETVNGLEGGLSKPLFLLGNVHFERAYLKKIPDEYPMAVNLYKKALTIFNDDPYCWFSLAHTYLKMDKQEDALGAFSKALYFMPAEDHQTDYWGVSIHSKIKIDEIKQRLGK